MAGSYNRIVLVGNVTRDPEQRDAAGKHVSKFGLAVNRKSKGADETMFFDIVAWERLSDICKEYIKKGMSLLVEGRLVIRSYETKEGEKRKAIEVVASDVQMLDRKSTGASSSSSAVHLPGNEDEDLDGGFIPF